MFFARLPHKPHDPDGDSLSINSVDNPANGSAQIINNQIVYTPDNNFTGQDIFDYTITDGNGGSDTAQITVNVNEIQPPNNLQITGQVRNDLDGDGNLSDPDPGIGGVRINLFTDFNNDGKEDPGGAIDFTTTANDGSYSFDNLDAGTYIVKEVDPDGATSTNDSNGANPNRVIDVSVSNGSPVASGIDFLDTFGAGAVNSDPDANNDSSSTLVDTPVTINVLGNDSDPDGDNLSISSVENPDNGTATIVNGQVSYAPDNGFTGSDSFEYTISDGNGGTDSATVTVTINDSPTGPNGKIEIEGTSAGDVLIGSKAAENLYGRGGADKIRAGGGADCLFGGNGQDTLKGAGGNDTIEGGTGNDIVYGGGGKDVLVGQDPSNQGFNEIDTLIGGAGKDVFVLGTADTVLYDIGGNNDYAKIEDFNTGDSIQLKGEADDYRVQGVGNSLYLYCKEMETLSRTNLLPSSMIWIH